ncbi:DUF4251 domain-containing protein [Ferruginibacter sp. HRS2-29]|uniref:DUF4251 domain-containing protein n=1 Tax=Ferruginibacter sp. HRS2-29 TaxID=2487334 RepID=UPI0020CE23DE|nr:DUF4251 domain-containing protein [Ferruginibacter sp. HRS2-29]
MLQRTAILFTIILTSLSTKAQLSKDSVAALVKSESFIFYASSVDPLRGTTRFLTGNYDLKVKGDSLVSYLPYFGRSQNAPISPDETGLIFTSTDFDYSFTPRKKNSWTVTFRVKDYTNLSKYVLTIYNDGSADLMATSNFRDQISFRGYVRGIKEK